MTDFSFPRPLKTILWKGIPSLILLCVTILASCSHNQNHRKGEYQSAAGMIWNTSYHITFDGPAVLADSVMIVLEEVGKSLNVFDSTSLVSRVNRADSLEIDEHFKRVYLMSRKIHEASEGMFDPSISPLIKAWGFGENHTVTADTAAIDSVLRFVGLGKTRLEGDRIIKDDRRTRFNFSAIAKGYGCDRIGEMLKRNGVDNYLVEIGGEIVSEGKAPGGRSWRISIDKPSESNFAAHASGAVMETSGEGVATSGNYRNFRKESGKSFGHTISPVTGRPVATDILSATVVAPTCMEADAAATACMAMGALKGSEMLRSLGYEGMFIKTDSTIWTSEGFRRRLLNKK